MQWATVSCYYFHFKHEEKNCMLFSFCVFKGLIVQEMKSTAELCKNSTRECDSTIFSFSFCIALHRRRRVSHLESLDVPGVRVLRGTMRSSTKWRPPGAWAITGAIWHGTQIGTSGEGVWNLSFLLPLASYRSYYWCVYILMKFASFIHI